MHDPDREAIESEFELYQALEKQEFPMSVQLARVLFLIGVRRNPALLWEATGEKLLARDANDAKVLFRMVSVLNARNTEPAFLKAVGYADRLIRLKPKDSYSYLAKASAYFWKSGRSHDRKDTGMAVENYDLALKVMRPPLEKYRGRIKSLADALRKSLKA